MKHYAFGMLLGIMLGISGNDLYHIYKYTTFAVPKYKVGDCLDNGLYSEKVIEIRKTKAFREALYIMQNYHANSTGIHKGRIDSSSIHYVDDTLTKTDSRYCEVTK